MEPSPFRTLGQPLPRNPVRTFFSSVLLGTALVLGGGGARFPATELVVQCVALIVLVYMLAEYRRDRAGPFDWLALGLLGLVILLPILQLIPLPASIWTALPGRELSTDVAAFIGTPDKAAPLSLIPDATRASLSALIVPAAMFVATLQADGREVRLLLWVAIGGALVSALLGVLQAAAGTGAPYLYQTAHTGMVTGVFANRNHQAALMVLALLTAWLLGRDRRRKGRALAMRWGLFGLMALFAAVTLATASRTGNAMLLIALLFVFAPLAFGRSRRSALIGGGIAIGLVLLIAVLEQTGAFQRLVGRMSLDEEARFEFWPDVVYGLKSVWPAGSGFGTFDPWFRSIEGLSTMGTLYVNHAHNDFLELILEGGAPAAVLIGLFLAFLAAAAWRLLRWRRTDPESRRGWIALGGILLILFHSVFDYPLRTFAIAAFFALLCGLLVRALRADNAAEEEQTAPETGPETP